MTHPELKDLICANKKCRRILAQTDGIKIEPVNASVISNKMSDKKKKYNPLYCVHCGHTTRIYKRKFQSKINKKFMRTGFARPQRKLH